jgi:hypothetical protein
MADAEVPADVQAFLHDRVESHEQLAALLLLRSTADKSWDAAQVASVLGIPEGIADEALRGLREQSLLSASIAANEVRFRYDPEPVELDGVVAKLEKADAEQKIDVLRLMTANAIERLRTKALTTFAEAFVLRRQRGKNG